MALRVGHPHGGAAGNPGEEPLDILISRMRRRHLRQVMRIENQSYPRPWSVGLFLSELSLPASRDYFVARAGGSLCGYAGMMSHGEEGHITNIAVGLEYRRHHIATRLMVQIVRAAIARGVTALTLEVRTGNHAAQSLYHRFGFAPAGVRRNYYPESGEDAIVMWAYDIDASEYRDKIEIVSRRIPGSTKWSR